MAVYNTPEGRDVPAIAGVGGSSADYNNGPDEGAAFICAVRRGVQAGAGGRRPSLRPKGGEHRREPVGRPP